MALGLTSSSDKKGEWASESEQALMVKTVMDSVNGETWPGSCLYLPGAQSLPVDENLSRKAGRYSVAVLVNDDGRAGDIVRQKTIPYLQHLESIGILLRRREMVPIRGGVDRESDVYELSPEHFLVTSTADTSCLPMGGTKTDEVNIRSLPESKVFFRITQHFLAKPSWARDPTALAARWPELRELLDKGLACEGEYDFDFVHLSLGTGMTTCRPAFNSYVFARPSRNSQWDFQTQ